MALNNYLIYVLWSNENHVYIGLTHNLPKRYLDHVNGRGSRKVKDLISKGYTLDVDILVDNLSESDAQRIEGELIKEYKALYGDSLLNIACGGAAPTGVSGEQHHASKLSDIQVSEIRTRWKNDFKSLTLRTLSAEYNVSVTTIHNIVNNKRSYDPEYAPPVESLKNFHPNRKLSEEDIVAMRVKYSNIGRKIVMSSECKLYNISDAYFSRLLRGCASPQLGGPILGRDYING